MKKVTKTLLIVLSIAILFLIINISSDRVMPWNKQQAIITTLSWAGLEPLPESSSEIKVWKKGSMFSRQFIIEFTSDQNSIDKWLNENSRLKNMKPIIHSSSIVKYDIHPGENGAIGGFITIDKELNKVTIDMSWS
ncbi:MAG: hypothetical protein EHM93_16655 [Bacteroidales bacterium]|nr:MAG: hypothetical protein EHM93_16655 [Bacteroidales bacterium]